jgi:hypothetical protein
MASWDFYLGGLKMSAESQMAAIEAEVEHERKLASAARDQLDLRMAANLLKSIDDKLIARGDLGASLQRFGRPISCWC